MQLHKAKSNVAGLRPCGAWAEGWAVPNCTAQVGSTFNLHWLQRSTCQWFKLLSVAEGLLTSSAPFPRPASHAGDLPWSLAPPTGVQWSNQVLNNIARAKSRELKDQELQDTQQQEQQQQRLAACLAMPPPPTTINGTPTCSPAGGTPAGSWAVRDSQLGPSGQSTLAVQMPSFLKEWIRYAMRLDSLEQPNYAYLHSLLDDAARELADAGQLRPQLTSHGRRQQQEVLAACGGGVGPLAGSQACKGQGMEGLSTSVGDRAKSFCGVASGGGVGSGGGAEGLGSWDGPSPSRLQSCIASVGDAGEEVLPEGRVRAGTAAAAYKGKGKGSSSGSPCSSSVAASSHGSGCVVQAEDECSVDVGGWGDHSSGAPSGCVGGEALAARKRRRVGHGPGLMGRLSLE